MYGIDTYDQRFCSDLISCGVIPKKSLILTFPDASIVPVQFQKDFIRGYFEGDGYLCFNKLGKTYEFSLLGTLDFCENARSIILSHTGVEMSVKPQKTVFRLRCTKKNNIYLICRWLYNDYNFSMTRKSDIAKQVFDFYG